MSKLCVVFLFFMSGVAEKVSIIPHDTGAALSFLNLAGKLKNVPRTGWVRRGLSEVCRVESVADHSWRMSAAAFLLSNTPTSNEKGAPMLDVGKVVQLAVLHDIAEAITGDIVPGDISKDDKRLLEDKAVEELTEKLGLYSPLAAEKVRLLIHEYESRSSPEAVAVKDLDMLEMVVQADEYEQSTGSDLSEFFESVDGRFRTPAIRAIGDKLVEARRTRRQNVDEAPARKRARLDNGDTENPASASNQFIDTASDT